MPQKKAATGFALRLREIRRQRGLTQERLAQLAGLHKLAIAKLEQGVQEPTWSTVVALVDALKLNGGDFWVPSRARLRRVVFVAFATLCDLLQVNALPLEQPAANVVRHGLQPIIPDVLAVHRGHTVIGVAHDRVNGHLVAGCTRNVSNA